MNSNAKAQHSGALAIWLVSILGLVSMCWWALAFLPMSPETPEWVKRAQYACFGTLPNGMPDTYGWIMLFFGPASFVVMMLFAFPSELMAGYRLFWKSRAIQLLMLVLVAGGAYETGWVAKRILAAQEMANVSFEPTVTGRLPAEYPRTAVEIPQFDLLDQRGNKVTNQTLRGKVVLLTYAFAHCQTVCPVLIRQTLRAAEKLPVGHVVSVYITLDPWRDTPASLPDLSKKWLLPENAFLLSGSVQQVNGVLDSLKVTRERDLKTGEVIHPSLIQVLDKDGKLAYSFNNPPVEWLVDAANLILQ